MPRKASEIELYALVSFIETQAGYFKLDKKQVEILLDIGLQKVLYQNEGESDDAFEARCDNHIFFFTGWPGIFLDETRSIYLPKSSLSLPQVDSSESLHQPEPGAIGSTMSLDQWDLPPEEPRTSPIGEHTPVEE